MDFGVFEARSASLSLPSPSLAGEGREGEVPVQDRRCSVPTAVRRRLGAQLGGARACTQGLHRRVKIGYGVAPRYGSDLGSSISAAQAVGSRGQESVTPVRHNSRAAVWRFATRRPKRPAVQWWLARSFGTRPPTGESKWIERERKRWSRS